MIIFGALHVVALPLGALLFYIFIRSDNPTNWQPPDEDDGGGGGNDRLPATPKPKPTGGIPLPDAEQSSVRLRGPGRLRDARPRIERRVPHPPTPAPARQPARRAGLAPRAPRPPVLARARVPAPHVVPRRLALPGAVDEQALLVDRRLRARLPPSHPGATSRARQDAGRRARGLSARSRFAAVRPIGAATQPPVRAHSRRRILPFRAAESVRWARERRTRRPVRRTLPEARWRHRARAGPEALPPRRSASPARRHRPSGRRRSLRSLPPASD